MIFFERHRMNTLTNVAPLFVGALFLSVPMAAQAQNSSSKTERGSIQEMVSSPEHKQRRAQVAKFIAVAENTRIFDLSVTWDENTPLLGAPNPTYSMVLDATHGTTRGTFGAGDRGDGGQLSLTTENQLWSGQHGAPTIDALGHIARNGKLFGGVDAEAATIDRRGIGRGPDGTGSELGIDRFPADKLINRAVLLDVARFVQGDDSPLPPDFEITAEHLSQTARAQNVEIEPGDTVLIRTGWGQHLVGNPELYRGANSPGLGLDGAQYLIDKKVFAAGNDTLTFEKRPPITSEPRFQIFPVHMRLIADSGIYIIENYYLEELSKAGAYEFLLATPPIKIRGGTGSALRSFALVPGQ